MNDQFLRDFNQTILADEKYRFSRVTYQLRRPDGGYDPHIRNLFQRPDACVLLPYDPTRKKLLLTRQFRLGAYMNDGTIGLLEACAGTIDGDEAPELCVVREAMEELGLKIERPRKLFEAFVSPAASTEKLHFFIAPYQPSERVASGGGLEEEGERIEVIEADFSEILRAAQAGEIRDGKTLTLLYWLQASGLMA